MATVIDALTVTLGLDNSQFTAGTKRTQDDLKKTGDAATRTAKAMQSDGAKAAEYFSSIKTQALSLLGVFVGARGLESAIKNSMNSMVSLSQKATNAGMPTADMQAFALAMERAGGNADSARDALVSYRQAMTAFFQGHGSTDQVAALGIMGIAPTMSPDQAMRRLMQDVEGAKTPAQWASLTGRATQAGIPMDVLNAMHQIGTVANYDKQIEASRAQWAANEKAEKAAFDLREATSNLNQSVDKLESVVMKNLSPSLIRFENWMRGVVDRATSQAEGGTNPDLDSYQLGMAPPAPPTAANLLSNMEETRAFWKSRGFTDAQVAGILAGGPGAESHFNPSLFGDNGTSYGMYQHHNERMRALFNFTGTNTPSVLQQNEFTYHELTTNPRFAGLLAAIKAHPNDERAVARAWSLQFEGPKGGEEEANRRAAGAGKYLPHTGPVFGPQNVPRITGFAGPRISNNDVDIGHITVNTQATNARGIASDLHAEIQTALAIRGLQ